jgi:hypothetical protein
MQTTHTLSKALFRLVSCTLPEFFRDVIKYHDQEDILCKNLTSTSI